MHEATALLTPVMHDLSVKVGRKRFRKKILPVDSITYNGQTIDFNPEYLQDLVQSFTDEAYDQVPFVLADENNRHNELPERFRGELDSLELTDDGLYGIISTSADGAKLLKENPSLGVSARIIEGLGKADGRIFKRAIRHICGTLDPRVSGLGPWQPVDLSDEATGTIETVDLSAVGFDKENDMARGAKSTVRKVGNKKIDLSKISDEEFGTLLDFATAVADAEVDDSVELDEDGEPIVRNEEGQRINPETGEVIEEEDPEEPELDEDGNPVEPETPEVPETPETPAVPAGRKKKVTKVTEETDLSNAVVDEQTRDTVSQMQIDLAAERWDRSREDYISAGVPPFLVDLAAPIMSSPQAVVVDLSTSDDPVNANEVIAKMLNGVKGMVDLTPQIGHTVDLSQPNEEGDALIDQWTKEFGTV